MKSTMRVFTTLVLAGLSLTAFAQDPFDLKVADFRIIQDKNVQKEIGLTEGQRKTMNGFADANNAAAKAKVAEYQKAKKQPDAAFNKFMYDHAVELQGKVLKTLSPNQLKRVREITLQAIGPRALLVPAVATKVGMSNAELNALSKAIHDGDNQVAAIKSQVAAKIREKYKTQKQPKTKKEADDLNAKLNADLMAEMKKHEPEMQKIINTSQQKAAAIVKKPYQEKLIALCGKPFAPAGAIKGVPKGPSAKG